MLSSLKTAFYYAEIFEEEVYNYNPCPNYFKWTSIGDINKTPFNEIWNSPRARLIRRKILKNNFSQENIAIYTANTSQTIKELSFVNTTHPSQEIMPLPKLVKLSHDRECNANCITCRKNVYVNSQDKIKELNGKIDTLYLPILQNADSVCLNGSGDTLASRHGQELIKAIASTYPKIKFCLHTNGILCNEKMLNELGIIDRLSVVEISIHATTKETYNKFIPNSNFQQVMNNLDFVAKLKTDKILLIFVITNFNYHEIPSFIDMAKKHNADTIFWTYKNWGMQNTEKEKQFSIFLKENSEYDRLKEILNKVKNEECAHFNYVLREMVK